MATKPLKSKSGLPRKMHLSYGRYFIVHKNKWIPLSRSLPEALRLYADWIQAQEQVDSNIKNLVAEYALILDAKHATGKLAKKTAENYQRRGIKFADVFKNAGHITEIEHSDIYTWRETFELSGQNAMWNLTHSYLKGFFQWCKDKSHIKVNPFSDIRKLETKSRTRLISEEEYQSIYTHADELMKSIMDMADLLAQRIGDVLDIRYEDITDTHVLVVQQKTKARLAIVRTVEVNACISAAKLACNVSGSTHLFHHTTNLKLGSHEIGRPISYGAAYHRWSAACEKAGIKDAHMHDIRAKAGTRADATGADAGEILGHKSRKNTEIYLRDLMYEEVMPSSKTAPESNSKIRRKTPNSK